MTRQRRTKRPRTNGSVPWNAASMTQGHPLWRALRTVLILVGAGIALSLTAMHLLYQGPSYPTMNRPTPSPSLPGRLEWRSAGSEPTPRDAAAVQIKDAYGSFAPITASGKGPALLVLPDGVTSGLISATHSGSSSFTVTCLNASGEDTGDFPAIASGAYEGTTVFGVAGHEAAHQLLVEYSKDQDWTLTVSPVFTAPPLALPASGVGDHVFLHAGAADQWRVIYSGDTSIEAHQFRPKEWVPALVIDYGPVDDVVDVEPGPSIIRIETDGPWRILRARSGMSPTASSTSSRAASPSTIPTSPAPRSTP